MKNRFEAVQIFFLIYPDVDLKFLDPVTYEGLIDVSASIILPLFLLHVYVCFAVIVEEPLTERNKENI